MSEHSEPPSTRWISIEPPSTTQAGNPQVGSTSATQPPSFHESQFGPILRRQRQRPPDNSGLKSYPAIPSRFVHLNNDFEFAGWGSITRGKLSQAAHEEGNRRVASMKNDQILGQFTAGALAGNAVLGSVFYALPAVVAVGGVYSPLCLFLATMIIFLWRPIMVELATILPISGAPYTYLLNISTKSFALAGAALLLLDFASTSIVSAATAMAYLEAEIPSMPFPGWVGTLLILTLFAGITLGGLRESARLALAVLLFHVGSMLVLMITASVHLSKIGISQLKENWDDAHIDSPPPAAIAKQIFYGTCLGMLGLTGFECIPSYVARIKPGSFPLVLRNLHLPAIILNTVVMFLVLATIPMDTVLSGANVLSVLARVSGGPWLRTWVVIDALTVLCGGVLTGITSANELFLKLSVHRVTPSFFRMLVPKTKAPWVAILSFTAFCMILYASAAASLTAISKMFSLVYLSVMALFPVSLMWMKFNRGRLLLPRSLHKEEIELMPNNPRLETPPPPADPERQTPPPELLTRSPTPEKSPASLDLPPERKPVNFIVVLVALMLVPAIFAGNIAVDSEIAKYWICYSLALVLFFSATQNKIHLLRIVYWIYDQYPTLHRWSLTKNWGTTLVKVMRDLRRSEVCILVKGDEINALFHMISYVRKNEETSYLKMVHMYEEEKDIPSELEANAKILDEAFPEITVDLVLINAQFNPVNVAALSHQLDIPQNLMFMSCPGPTFRAKWEIEEFDARIITI